MPLGQRSEAAAWHTARGGKPVLYFRGAQPLWLPLVSHVFVGETSVSRPVFNGGPFQEGEV